MLLTNKINQTHFMQYKRSFFFSFFWEVREIFKYLKSSSKLGFMQLSEPELQIIDISQQEISKDIKATEHLTLEKVGGKKLPILLEHIPE